MFTALQDAYSQLPVAERQVADFILKNPNKALFMTVKEISNAVGVSEGSVIRMAQRCGFKGFSDFKIQLAVNFETERSIYDSVKDENGFAGALFDLFEVHIKTLKDTLESINTSDLENVVSKIDCARKTQFYGVGGSGIVAQDAAHKLQRMDIPAWGFSDTHTQLAMASLLTSDCVAVGISHSGMTRETIEALQIAKKSGATTVSITSNAHSPIRHVSDFILKTSVKEPILRSGSVAARIAQLSVIDAITVGIRLIRKDQTGRQFDNTSSVIIGRKVGGEDESID